MLRLNERTVEYGDARRCGSSAGASISNQTTASNTTPNQPIGSQR